MISVKSYAGVQGDGLTRRSPADEFAADESGVRWGLVSKVRQAIEDGSYDEEARMDAMLDKLATALEL